MPTYVLYKGQYVTPMELRMIKEREQAEEEERQRAKEEREPAKKQKIPKRPTTPMERRTRTEYEKARQEAEKKAKKKEKPKPSLSTTGPLDVEHYPTASTPPMPKLVQRFQETWMRYEQTMGAPSEYMRAKASQTLIKAVEAKTEGRGIEAGFYFSTYMFQRAGAGIYEGLTIPIRPLALAQTLGTTIKLVDPKFRKEIGKAISLDPGGFTAELTGGFLGGYAFGKGVQYAKLKYRTFKQTRFEKQYPIEDFLPYEQELLTPQPTQDVDFRSLITEERAKPVVWEYRGGRRPTISVSQKPPTLKEYPDPTRVELMGGKAITDLVTLKEVSKARMTIEPAWIPGLRISDIGPTISRTLPRTTPYLYGLLATTQAIEQARKQKIREPSRVEIKTKKEQPDIGITPVRVLKPIGRGRRRQREPTLPEYIVGPTEIEEQIQPTLPGYIQEPITRTRTRTRTRTIQEPTPILEPVPIQITRGFPSIPRIDQFIPSQPAGPFRIRYEVKRKKRLGIIDLLRVGEIREYSVKLPEELLKGI